MIPFNFPTIARRNHIIGLSTPIILGMVSINVIDIVDTAMIGFLGNKALAGVGVASFLFWGCFTMIIGIGSAVQTVTARRLGEDRLLSCGQALNAGLMMMLIFAIPIMIVMFSLSPFILSFFTTDPEVHQFSISYFRWRILGLAGVGASICYRGFWNGIKSPNTYTIILLATQLLNGVLTWIFIFGKFGCPP